METLYAPFIPELRPPGTEPSSPQLVWRPPFVGQRASTLSRTLEGFTAAPTPSQLQELETIAKDVAAFETPIAAIVSADLAALNRALNQAGQPPIAAAVSRAGTQ